MDLSAFNFSEYFKFFIGLFVLVNPIGIMPIFISMTSRQKSKDRNKTNLIANLSSAIIMFISLLFGNFILNIFGISINSFRISGGILVSIVAMSMITGKINKKDKNTKNLEDISVIPLAMPLISGPGVISSIIIFSTHHYNILGLLFSSFIIVLFSVLCFLFFLLAPSIVKILGKTGINILTRIMGLLLMSLSIEFIINGIKSSFTLL
ncbi:UPF0056 membrane protein YhcE [Buchnera aphidicola (Neophyllaphis podocarpi)]|uniref:YchE family NAAT transporter n=1 Tax=Buchnera aphidicola TaxID=9 RepID=UPI003464CAB7